MPLSGKRILEVKVIEKSEVGRKYKKRIRFWRKDDSDDVAFKCFTIVVDRKAESQLRRTWKAFISIVITIKSNYLKHQKNEN